MDKIKKELYWFLIPTFTITYGLGLIAYLLGGLSKFPLMTVSMFVPALIVIILYKFKFKKPVIKNNDLGLRFKGFRYWPVSLILMLMLVSAGYLIPFLFQPSFFKSPDLILEITEKTGVGVGNWLLNLIIIFGINLIIAPIQNILMFLGEEIGWRAFLFPRLLKLYGPKMSFIISGIIWGLWHSAGIALGHNYPELPILGNLFMILMCIPLGVIFQYLYFKSKSVFAPAIAHGVTNWTAYNFGMFILADERYNTVLYGPTGIIGIAVLCVVAVILFNKLDWIKENTYQS